MDGSRYGGQSDGKSWQFGRLRAYHSRPMASPRRHPRRVRGARLRRRSRRGAHAGDRARRDRRAASTRRAQLRAGARQLAADFDRPLPVVYGEQALARYSQQLGAGASDRHGRREGARRTARERRSACDVRWSSKKVQRFVAAVAQKIDRAAVDATLVSVGRSGPVISRPSRTASRSAGRSCGCGSSAQLGHEPAHADRRADAAGRRRRRRAPTSGRSIWVEPRLEHAAALQRREPRAHVRRRDGQAQYPTPSGMWHDRDHAARSRGGSRRTRPGRKGEKPVPPGPGNPLGTRWMGLDAAASASTARPTPRRSATRPRTAASGCASRTRSGCSAQVRRERPSTSPRRGCATDSRAAFTHSSTRPTTAAVPTTITGASARTCSRRELEQPGDTERREHAQRAGDPEQSAAHRHDYPVCRMSDGTQLLVGRGLRRRVPRLPLRLQRAGLRAARHGGRREARPARRERARRGRDGRPRGARRRRRHPGSRAAGSGATSCGTGSASRSSGASRSSTGCGSSSSAARGSTTA